MPLANEFQQKLQKQAQELQSAKLPQNKQVESPQDTMIVMNILIDGNTEVNEAIPYATQHDQYKDPRTPSNFDFNRLDNNIYEHSWNTKDYFEVRWDGRPHRIKPGEKRFFPRYLADHFAKHLIDFILTEREEKEKLKGLLKNRIERQKLYEQIVVGVASYYNGDAFDSEREGLQTERLVEQMNQQPAQNAFDVGVAANPAMGYGLTDKEPEKVDDNKPLIGPAQILPQQPKTPEQLIEGKSRQELMSEAKQLGLEVTRDMTKDQLAQAILNF